MDVPSPGPANRPPLWRDIVMGLGVFGLYVLVAAHTSGRGATADRNAHAVLTIERWLHIDVERGLNHWLIPHGELTVLANYEYAYTYVISAFLLLTWLYVRLPEQYRRARDSFLLLNLIAIGCFAAIPLTPPRLLQGAGYIDTVAAGGTFGSWGTPLVSSANKLAAMPSLHLGWALWVSVVLARLARGVAVQLLSAVHVAVTLFVIVATANHFLLDAVAAVPFVWLSVALTNRRYDRCGLVPAADAFFLHVETPCAPQHVGGMVVLAPDSAARPAVEEIRALLRSQLGNMPRFRQRPVQPSPAHRWRWVDVDPDAIDWEWHVSERIVEGVNDIRDLDGAAAILSRTVAQLAAEPMPRDRPMWRVVLVRNIAPYRCGLVLLVHHSVADGVGTILQILNILRPRLTLPVPTRHLPGVLPRAAATAAGLAQLATDGRPAAMLPAGSARRSFAAAVLDMNAVRTAARDRGVRVTDVLLWLMSTALHRTHPQFSAAVGQRLRVSVPMMLRQLDSSGEGNMTAAVMMDLPLSPSGDHAGLEQIRQTTAELLTAPRALAARFVMARVLGVCPVMVQRLFARAVYGPAFLQAILSNMQGPEHTMSIAGVPLDRVIPILPLAPSAPIALGALSWTGVLGLGLAADPEYVDADQLLAAMVEEFNQLPGMGPDHSPMCDREAYRGTGLGSA